MKRLEGKKIIVTGGTRGIGKSIVEICLKEGAVVSATYKRSDELAKKLQNIYSSEGYSANFYKLDVSDKESVRKIVPKMIEDMDGIDVLINNAGITKDSLIYMMSDDDWDDVIKTNLYGAFYVTKSVLLEMVSQKSGSIINMSSVSGLIGVRGQGNYCASKFGVVGLTKALAKELAYKNIRVNAVAPGYVETDMVSSLSTNVKNEILKEGSLKRLGQPEEIAKVVVFLASSESSYMTGQVVVADGGLIG